MKKLNRKIEITEVLEQWARYRQGRIDGGIGWPKKVPLGKLREGLPTNRCPICIGREKPHHNCPVCGGDGRIKLEVMDDKANPAFIRGNGPVYSYDDDPQSQRVDWLVCTVLEEDERVIIIKEFCDMGNRNTKISRLHITHSYYNDVLDSAMQKIEKNI